MSDLDLNMLRWRRVDGNLPLQVDVSFLFGNTGAANDYQVSPSIWAIRGAPCSHYGLWVCFKCHLQVYSRFRLLSCIESATCFSHTFFLDRAPRVLTLNHTCYRASNANRPEGISTFPVCHPTTLPKSPKPQASGFHL